MLCLILLKQLKNNFYLYLWHFFSIFLKKSNLETAFWTESIIVKDGLRLHYRYSRRRLLSAMTVTSDLDFLLFFFFFFSASAVSSIYKCIFSFHFFLFLHFFFWTFNLTSIYAKLTLFFVLSRKKKGDEEIKRKRQRERELFFFAFLSSFLFVCIIYHICCCCWLNL